MKLRPLGDRVFIEPELPPTVTESGIILAEHRKPEQTGTVIAVGPCVHPLQAEAAAMAGFLEQMDVLPEAADLLRRATQRQPLVKVGDYVLFSWTAGQEIWVEDEGKRYLSMKESDIMAVIELEEAV